MKGSVKLCKNCQHCLRLPFESPSSWACALTIRESPPNVLTGKVYRWVDWCDSQRSGVAGRCGPEGKKFEPITRKHWWQFWRKRSKE